MKRESLSLLAAIVVPALTMTGWYLLGQFMNFDSNDPFIWVRTMTFMVMCLLIAGGHVLVLGLPSFLILRWANYVRSWSALAVGFLSGCIPAAIVGWPLKYPELKSNSSHWDGEQMVQTMINGVPTTAGWISYGNGVLFMGAFGVIGGLAFWLVWRRHDPQQAVQGDGPASGGAAP